MIKTIRSVVSVGESQEPLSAWSGNPRDCSSPRNRSSGKRKQSGQTTSSTVKSTLYTTTQGHSITLIPNVWSLKHEGQRKAMYTKIKEGQGSASLQGEPSHVQTLPSRDHPQQTLMWPTRVWADRRDVSQMRCLDLGLLLLVMFPGQTLTSWGRWATVGTTGSGGNRQTRARPVKRDVLQQIRETLSHRCKMTDRHTTLHTSYDEDHRDLSEVLHLKA